MDRTALSWMFFAIWALVGVVFIGVSLLLRRVRLRKAERCTLCVPGTVVELAYRRSKNGGMYYPVVEYAVGGKKVRARASTGRNPARYRMGEGVRVCCDPDAPEYFCIEGDTTMALLEKVFLFVGLACILIGSIAAYAITRIA